MKVQREGKATHHTAVAAVVGVVVDVSFATGTRGCHGAVKRAARLEAVGAEACVVRLAGAVQVAGLCMRQSKHPRHTSLTSGDIPRS